MMFRYIIKNYWFNIFILIICFFLIEICLVLNLFLFIIKVLVDMVWIEYFFFEFVIIFFFLILIVIWGNRFVCIFCMVFFIIIGVVVIFFVEDIFFFLFFKVGMYFLDVCFIVIIFLMWILFDVWFICNLKVFGLIIFFIFLL